MTGCELSVSVTDNLPDSDLRQDSPFYSDFNLFAETDKVSVFMLKR